MEGYTPTDQQTAIIEHEGSAFVSACPGAGKTRCIVERARKVLANPRSRQSLAFLSFTNAAISELQDRLTNERLLPNPPFPHFVGTFDSFIWHFLVEPFGLNDCDANLKVVPDTGELNITPFPSAQPLPLKCFDRLTGQIIPEEASKLRFTRDPARYETTALRLRARLLVGGHLDFEDVRRVAKDNLEDKAFSGRLARTLNNRFGELIVDEAQDCNPDDLAIIDWLRNKASIPTKIVCDPHQSIYGFRGGVSAELFEYAKTFPTDERLPLTGNFRSSQSICQAVHILRAPSQRGSEDDALGDLRDLPTKVHILRYAGSGVSMKIGHAFSLLASTNDIDINDCRLTAKTRNSGLKAVGSSTTPIGQSLSLRLANAVMNFHQSSNSKNQLAAISDAHRVILTISGKLSGRTYHQVIAEDNLDAINWRGQVVKILQALHFDQASGHNQGEWISRARNELAPFLPNGKGTIGRSLRNQTDLGEILMQSPTPGLQSRTIHEVKGKEYEGMCVVLTTAKAKGILTRLETEPDNSNAEDAREIYVAASRAKKLLVFACPRSQSERLAKHLSSNGAQIQVTEI